MSVSADLYGAQFATAHTWEGGDKKTTYARVVVTDERSNTIAFSTYSAKATLEIAQVLLEVGKKQALLEAKQYTQQKIQEARKCSTTTE